MDLSALHAALLREFFILYAVNIALILLVQGAVGAI